PAPANAGAAFTLGTIRDRSIGLVSLPNGQPDLTSAQNVQGTCTFSVAFLQSSNQNLDPETSNQYTAGFILEPIKGWTTTFDYYYIKVKNQIINVANTPTFGPTPENTVRGAQQTVAFYD